MRALLAALARGCLLAAFAGAGLAEAADLFRPATAEDIRTAALAGRAPEAAGLIRHRFVRLDEEGLAALAVDSRESSSEPLGITLFPDLALRARRTASEAFDGGAVWAGRAEGPAAVTLVVEAGRVTGHAAVGRRTFRIDPVAGGVHRVAEIDPRAERPDIVVRPPGAARAPVRKPVVEPLARSTIRVLVAYTTAAEAEAGDIVGRIRLAVALANEAYAASGARLRIELADAIGVDWAEPDDFGTTLEELASGRRLSNVRRRRDETRSDLVVLVRGSGALCGIGYLIDDPGAKGMDAFGYAVVAEDCIDNHSFAHELGHLMGLEHDRYAVFWDEPDQYNYGYVNLEARIRDIMAYNSECVAEGFDCTRVNVFSTPRRPFEGSRLGKRMRSPVAADGVRRMNETRGAVADFR